MPRLHPFAIVPISSPPGKSAETPSVHFQSLTRAQASCLLRRPIQYVAFSLGLNPTEIRQVAHHFSRTGSSVSKVDHNLKKFQGRVRLTYLHHSQEFSVSAMNITYLSACLMLIGTIVGNSNASTSGPSKPITVCGGVEEIFKDGKCPTNGCKTVVVDGQYKLKCTNIYCRRVNCTKSQWKSTGEVCYGCKNGI
ncbi:hypothetical protein PSHT_00184 [Puccinia striiformis]|uniref:Uncharacterized protein n=1 Tax=Puccinia striiformis TaxID=27350 RepID=A0A2S4WNR4_9BASI|nr:hypothetical protein PSHT_00184 [Puccinia striiformis]